MNLIDFNIFNFARRINRPLILDGAMGSLLQQYNINTTSPLWASIANLEHRELVLKIHREYIEAGADIITSNTFRTNPSAVYNSKLSANQKELVKVSVEIAKEAKQGLPVLIAGSNAPAEDCYQVERTINHKELEQNHHEHIELLWDNGCDYILNETQSHLDEIRIICDFCSKNRIPFVLSLFFTNDLKLLSGEHLSEAIKLICDYQPLAIGFNCIQPETFVKAKDHLISSYLGVELLWGAYLNCGSGSFTDEVITCGIDEFSYQQIIKDILTLKPAFVGACCGSTPNHIKLIRELLNGIS